jgi:hypothetical protein
MSDRKNKQLDAGMVWGPVALGVTGLVSAVFAFGCLLC